ncbi:hypothetical protein ABK040_001807 [Willaertia magna]
MNINTVFNNSPYIITTSDEYDGNSPTNSPTSKEIKEEKTNDDDNSEIIEIDQKLISMISGQFEMISVLKLDLNSLSLNKIKNLNRCIKMEYLDLSQNNIQKMEGLENLVNLKRFNLSNNQIEVIEGIENLKNLEYFNLENNNIKNFEDISQLQFLPKLKYINLNGNPISQKSGFDEEIKKLCKSIQVINGEHIALKSFQVPFDEKESIEIPQTLPWTTDDNGKSIFSFDDFNNDTTAEKKTGEKEILANHKKVDIDCKKLLARADLLISEMTKH